MIKPRDPRELVIDLLPRSTCAVQVAAVIADDYGIFSWSWNNSGRDGLGEHAEAAAIRRANKNRLQTSSIYVASLRRRGNKVIGSRPCDKCLEKIRSWDLYVVWYRQASGRWELLSP